MRIVNLYGWLHYRFPDVFPDIEIATRERRTINRRINTLLKRTRTEQRHCPKCGTELPSHHHHALCTPCWKRGRIPSRPYGTRHRGRRFRRH